MAYTTLGPGRYGRLFTPKTEATSNAHLFEGSSAVPGGPAAVPESEEVEAAKHPKAGNQHQVELGGKLSFAFKPDIAKLINPDQLHSGTDIECVSYSLWHSRCGIQADVSFRALHAGLISITPLRASFAMGDVPAGLQGGKL